MSDIAEIIERRLADGRHIGDADCAKAAQRIRELEAERDSAIKERDDMAANAASWLDRADEAHGKLEAAEAERDEAAQRIRELEADLSEAMQACDSLRDRTLERTVRAQAAEALLGKVGEVLPKIEAALSAAQSLMMGCGQWTNTAGHQTDAALWIEEAARLMTQYARESGEAKGRLEMSEAAGMVDMWREHALAADKRREAAEALLAKVGEVLEPFSAAYGRGDGWPKEAQSVTRSYATCPTVRSWHFRKAATLHAEIIASQNQPSTEDSGGDLAGDGGEG